MPSYSRRTIFVLMQAQWFGLQLVAHWTTVTAFFLRSFSGLPKADARHGILGALLRMTQRYLVRLSKDRANGFSAVWYIVQVQA